MERKKGSKAERQAARMTELPQRVAEWLNGQEEMPNFLVVYLQTNAEEQTRMVERSITDANREAVMDKLAEGMAGILESGIHKALPPEQGGVLIHNVLTISNLAHFTPKLEEELVRLQQEGLPEGNLHFVDEVLLAEVLGKGQGTHVYHPDRQ